ncbi:hypothetical protein [Parasphingorhabdus sp.]|uniref:hypothetical protein n=1 Tax=Parasphingorhabdus sp. TaxID=2709688 RepID=UPI003262D269
MNSLIGVATMVLALGFSSTALAQDADRNRSTKGAVVVELEAPKFADVARGRAAQDSTYYQSGNRRNGAERGVDATKFCNSINYTYGSVLEYKTLPTETAEYDYLKRVICFE